MDISPQAVEYILLKESTKPSAIVIPPHIEEVNVLIQIENEIVSTIFRVCDDKQYRLFHPNGTFYENDIVIDDLGQKYLHTSHCFYQLWEAQYPEPMQIDTEPPIPMDTDQPVPIVTDQPVSMDTDQPVTDSDMQICTEGENSKIDIEYDIISEGSIPIKSTQEQCNISYN